MTGRGRPKAALQLAASERATLQRLADAEGSAELGLRARIVLACGDGRANIDVARRLGVSPATVSKWRARFIRLGVAGLTDSPRSGRPRSGARTQAARALLGRNGTPPLSEPPPSTRELARRHGISQATAARLRAEHAVRLARGSGARGAEGGLLQSSRHQAPRQPDQPRPASSQPPRALLSERLYEVLRRKIVSGQLLPGQRVVESELARATGTSQAPARDAIRRLAHEGLVTHRPHLGNFVATVSPAQAREAREVRVMIEAAAARRAAGQLADTELCELTTAVERMSRAARAGDVGAFREADMAFHRQVCAASGNSVLFRVWQTLEPTLWSLHVVSDALFEGDRELMARCHLPLIESLERGHPEVAARLFAAHARGEGSHVERSVAGSRSGNVRA